MGLRWDAGVEREVRGIARLWSPETGPAVGQRLQRKYLASLLWADRNAVSNGTAK
jgi:hypothetical protein